MGYGAFPALIHPPIALNIGKLSASTTATTGVGVPDPAALAVFGNAPVGWKAQIAVVHLHMDHDLGSGSLSVEVFIIERAAPHAYTYLGTLTYTGGDGDYATKALVPATPTFMIPGHYLYAQLRTFTGGGGGEGVDVDAHFVGGI